MKIYLGDKQYKLFFNGFIYSPTIAENKALLSFDQAILKDNSGNIIIAKENV